MSTSKRDLFEHEMLENLLRTMHDDPISDMEVDERLKAMGYDPAVVALKGTEAVLRLQGKLRLESGRERRRLLEKAHELLEQLRSITDPDAITAAMRLVTGGQQQYAGFFSKVKDLSEQDSRQIVDDADLLKILESLESEDPE